MNVLFLSKDYPPDLIGGVGVYIKEISRLLVKMGHSAHIITATDDTPIEYTDAGVRVYRVRPKKIKLWRDLMPIMGGLLQRLEYSLAVSEKITEIIRRYPIDLIEASEARAEGFWYYLLRRRPPLVIKLHTPETLAFKLDHTPQTLDFRLLKALEAFWISRATQRTGISQEVVDLASRHFSMKLGGVPLLPNPIDIELFRPSSHPDTDNHFNILYVGRLEFRKGVHILIRAFAYLQTRIPDATLTFIGGDCGMKGYLLKRRAGLKNPGSVTLIDQVPRESLVEQYQKSTLCVVPSIWENYPYVCLEAMSCGKPVVASNIGGLKSMIKHGHSGWLVAPGSSRDLGEALTLLLGDHQLRRRLGSNARSSIEQNYSPEVVAGKTIELYKKILKR